MAVLLTVLTSFSAFAPQDASAQLSARILCTNGTLVARENEAQGCPAGTEQVSQEIFDQCGPPNYVEASSARECINNAGGDATDDIGGDEEGEGEEEEDNSCENHGDVMGWILCPVIYAVSGALNFLDTFIESLLTISPDFYDNDNIRGVWASMRNIAFILLVPTTLIMVISTALGMDFMSAYTIKRALPRLLLAVVFMALSYDLTVFFVEFVNALGQGMLGLISSQFGEDSQALQLTNLFGEGLYTGLINWVAVIAAGKYALGALAVLVLYLPTILLVALTGYLILLLRQMLIVAMIVIAPLAVVAWIFAERTRLWNLWWDTFSKLLFMFPLIMIVIAIGRAFAYILLCPDGECSAEYALNNGLFGLLTPLVGLLAYMAPYAFIPFTFRLAGGAFATLTGMIQDREKGLFDRARNKREQAGQRAMEGTTGFGGAGKSWSSAYRRMKTKGGYSFRRKGRLDYRAREQNMLRAGQQKAMEADAGRMAESDQPTFYAATANNRREFVEKYQEIEGVSKAEAEKVASDMEASYGASMGSVAMQRAATESFVKSKSNTDTLQRMNKKARNAPKDSLEATHEMLGDFLNPVAAQVANGSMTIDDAASLVKSANRAEYRSQGYGHTREIVEEAAKRYKRGGRGADLIDAKGGRGTAQGWMEDSVDHMQSGMIAGAPERTAHVVSGTIARELVEQHRISEDSSVDKATRQTAKRNKNRLLGKVSAIHDMAAQGDLATGSVYHRGLLDNKDLSRALGIRDAKGNLGTVMGEIENLKRKGDPNYLSSHKEFMAGSMSEEAHREQQSRAGSMQGVQQSIPGMDDQQLG